MHLVTYLHPRLPTDSAEEPELIVYAVYNNLFNENEITILNKYISENEKFSEYFDFIDFIAK